MRGANPGRDLDRALRSFGAVKSEAKRIETERREVNKHLTAKGSAIHKKVMNMIANSNLGKFIADAMEKVPGAIERISAKYREASEGVVCGEVKGLVLYAVDVQHEGSGEAIGKLEYVMFHKDLSSGFKMIDGRLVSFLNDPANVAVYFIPDEEKIQKVKPYWSRSIQEFSMIEVSSTDCEETSAKSTYAVRGEKEVLSDVQKQLGEVAKALAGRIHKIVQERDRKNKKQERLISSEDQRGRGENEKGRGAA